MAPLGLLGPERVRERPQQVPPAPAMALDALLDAPHCPQHPQAVTGLRDEEILAPLERLQGEPLEAIERASRRAAHWSIAGR